MTRPNGAESEAGIVAGHSRRNGQLSEVEPQRRRRSDGTGDRRLLSNRQESALLGLGSPAQDVQAEGSEPIRRGQRCECNGCGAVFMNVRAFDRHRTGKHGVLEGPDRRRCLDGTEVVTIGLQPSARGWRLPPHPYNGSRSRAGAPARRARP